MGVGKTISAACIALVLCVCLVIVGVQFSSFVLLDGEVWEEAFVEHDVYVLFERSIEEASMGDFIVFEPDVETTVNRLLSDFFGYLNGESDVLRLRVSVDREQLRAFFLRQISGFPICVDGQPSFVNGDPSCRPPTQSQNDFLDEVLARQTSNPLEQEYVDLVETLDPEGNVAPLQQSIQTYRYVLYAVVTLAFIMLLLLFFIYSRERALAFRWIGWSFVGASVILVLIAGISFMSANASDFPLSSENEIDFSFLVPLIATIVGKVITRMLLIALVLGIIGICGIGGSYYFVKHSTQKIKKKR